MKEKIQRYLGLQIQLQSNTMINRVFTKKGLQIGQRIVDKGKCQGLEILHDV